MFTKFYLGILFAALLAAGSCYALFSYSFSERQGNYQTRALSGPLRLILDTLPTLDSDDQRAYLDIAYKLLGASVITSENLPQSLQINQSTLSQRVGANLLHNNDQEMIWALTRDGGAPQFISVPALSEQQFRAHSLLLLSHLKGYAQSDDLRLIQPYSSFDVDIVQPSRLTLDPQQIQDLSNKRVVVLNLSNQRNTFSVLAPMGEDKALKVGPIPVFEALPFDTAILMIGVSFFVFIGVAYWIIYVLASRIKPIDNMVEAFGEGQLEARILLKGSDHFTGLATRINFMAARIKSLLETQRSIMQAVSHELRTPLARIRFKLAIIDESFNEEQNNKTDPIRKDITQVEQLIDEILEYHKLSQQSELHLQPIQIEALLSHTQSDLESLFPNVTLVFECTGKIDLVADERAIKRLTQNLCSNACKHAKSQVKVTVRAKQSVVFLAVDDDGNGIPDEEKQKVFDAFYRADSELNQQQKGYGLGLSIVQQIVRLHEGKIHLKDSVLGGAMFEVEIPVRHQKMVAENG